MLTFFQRSPLLFLVSLVLAALAFPRTARADLAPESPGCGGARSRYQCEDVVGARCLDANNDWHTCEAEPSNRTCFKPNPNYRLCAQTQQGVAQRDAGRDANPSHMDASLNDAGDFAGDAGAAPSDAGEPPLDAGEGSRDAGASCDSLIAYPCLRCTGPAKDGGCQTGAEASTALVGAAAWLIGMGMVRQRMRRRKPERHPR